jgi:hypothetical protein
MPPEPEDCQFSALPRRRPSFLLCLFRRARPNGHVAHQAGFALIVALRSACSLAQQWIALAMGAELGSRRQILTLARLRAAVEANVRGTLGDKRPPSSPWASPHAPSNRFFRSVNRVSHCGLMLFETPPYSLPVAAVRVRTSQQNPAPLTRCGSTAPVPILDRIRCGDAWGRKRPFCLHSDLGVSRQICKRQARYDSGAGKASSGPRSATQVLRPRKREGPTPCSGGWLWRHPGPPASAPFSGASVRPAGAPPVCTLRQPLEASDAGGANSDGVVERVAGKHGPCGDISWIWDATRMETQ